MADSIVLKVAMPQRQTEAGYGRARLDSASRRELNVDIGDVIEIVGKRTVVAKVFPSSIDEEGQTNAKEHILICD